MDAGKIRRFAKSIDAHPQKLKMSRRELDAL
jgi:hypothetical protein